MASGVANSSAECVMTYEFYSTFSKVVLGMAAFPVLCAGLLANLVSIRIFSHPVMLHSPINWYLVVLSSSDLLILITSFFFLVLPRLCDLFLNVQGMLVFYYSTVVVMPLGVMAQTVSIYMTVLMSLHRFVGVCFPFKVGNIISKTRIKIAIGFVIGFAVLFNFTRFFELIIEGECKFSVNLANHTHLYTLVALPEDGFFNGSSPSFNLSAFRTDPLYVNIFYGVSYTLIMFVIPFLCLLGMNSAVVIAIHRTRKMHSQMHGADDHAKRQELAKEISTSVMLVGIVVVFFLCNTLPFICNVIETFELLEPGSLLFSDLVTVGNLTVIFNASINIFVYCLFSEKYRLLLKYFLCCHWMRDGDMLVSALN